MQFDESCSLFLSFDEGTCCVDAVAVDIFDVGAKRQKTERPPEKDTKLCNLRKDRSAWGRSLMRTRLINAEHHECLR